MKGQKYNMIYNFNNIEYNKNNMSMEELLNFVNNDIKNITNIELDMTKYKVYNIMKRKQKCNKILLSIIKNIEIIKN
jgi:hypothetical protein